MSEAWVETTLGEVADYVNGYPFKPTELSGTRLPVIRIKQLLDPSAKVDFTDVEVPDRVRLSDGDLIFSWSGSLASRIWDRGPAVLNQHLFRVIERPGVSRGWLHLALDHAVEELITKTHGTTMKHVTKGVLESHPVLLPPLPVQRRIVDVMAHLDDHVANLRAEREVVHRIWLAMINSSFSNNSWPRVPIGEVVAAGGGRLVDGDWIESKDQAPEGIRLLQLADLSRGRFLNKSERFVSRETFQRLRCTDIKEGDLLISRMADPIGRTARVPDVLHGSIAAVDVAILTPGLNLDGDYLLGILNSTPWIETCDTQGTGTTRKRISKGNLARIEIPVPDLSAQQHLGANFAGCVATIEYIDLEVSAVEGLRHRLLAALLGGHTRIADSYDTLLPEAS